MSSDFSSRRDLLRFAALAGAGLGLPQSQAQQSSAQSMAGKPFEKKEAVRLGLIGVGGRGNSHVDNFGGVPQVSDRRAVRHRQGQGSPRAGKDRTGWPAVLLARPVSFERSRLRRAAEARRYRSGRDCDSVGVAHRPWPSPP